MEAVLDELEECIAGSADVEGAYLAKELEKSIHHFVKYLPERDGNVFIQRYFFTKSTEEIAEKYDMGLYPIPMAESVPKELWGIVNNQIFRAEELPLDAVWKRAYKVEDAGDVFGYRMQGMFPVIGCSLACFTAMW